MSRIRSPVASELGQGHVDPLGAGPATNLGSAYPPLRAAPSPNETDQAHGCVVVLVVLPPQFPAGVDNSLPGGRLGSALSVCRNKRLVCLGRCSCCSLGERLKQGPSRAGDDGLGEGLTHLGIKGACLLLSSELVVTSSRYVCTCDMRAVQVGAVE